MTAEQYIALKQQEETLRRDADRGRGALDQLRTRLQDEHRVADEKEAAVLLKRLQKELAEAERMADKALADFEQEWGKKLECI
mgnify:CR=1 FL=1